MERWNVCCGNCLYLIKKLVELLLLWVLFAKLFDVELIVSCTCHFLFTVLAQLFLCGFVICLGDSFLFFLSCNPLLFLFDFCLGCSFFSFFLLIDFGPLGCIGFLLCLLGSCLLFLFALEFGLYSWIVIICSLAHFQKPLSFCFFILLAASLVFLLHPSFLISVLCFFLIILIILTELSPCLELVPVFVELVNFGNRGVLITNVWNGLHLGEFSVQLKAFFE